MPNPRKITLSIYVDRKDYDAIKKAASRDERSMASFVRRATMDKILKDKINVEKVAQ